MLINKTVNGVSFAYKSFDEGVLFNGGSLLIDNLQFISWFENRAKSDIDQELWNKMKQKINYYL